MHQCKWANLSSYTCDSDMPHRFKRIGPNAMKGRGIGTARGRATIMRANARRGRGGPPPPGIRR